MTRPMSMRLPSSSSSSSSSVVLFLALASLLLGPTAGVDGQTTFSATGDTASAPLSDGNPSGGCADLHTCINGCRSDFYSVEGGSGTVNVQTCSDPITSFHSRLFVWEGYPFFCLIFACIGGA
jgi:hypothetical protein